MEKDADNALASTDITAEGRDIYDAVSYRKFDKFSRSGLSSKGLNSTAGTRLKEKVVENCEYGALKEDLLRDRIVVGIRDKGLSENCR